MTGGIGVLLCTNSLEYLFWLKGCTYWLAYQFSLVFLYQIHFGVYSRGVHIDWLTNSLWSSCTKSILGCTQGVYILTGLQILFGLPVPNPFWDVLKGCTYWLAYKFSLVFLYQIHFGVYSRGVHIDWLTNSLWSSCTKSILGCTQGVYILTGLPILFGLPVPNPFWGVLKGCTYWLAYQFSLVFLYQIHFGVYSRGVHIDWLTNSLWSSCTKSILGCTQGVYILTGLPILFGLPVPNPFWGVLKGCTYWLAYQFSLVFLYQIHFGVYSRGVHIDWLTNSLWFSCTKSILGCTQGVNIIGRIHKT